MASKDQKEAARENVRKARRTWQEMSPRERSRARPEGRARTEPGTRGGGEYYHVTVHEDEHYETFRTHDVGREGHTQRVAGRTEKGNWSTQKWLIHKADAHVEDGTLVADTDGAREVLDQLGSKPRHKEGDKFTATPRRNVPEDEKPTKAQREARRENIKKAQKARRES